MQKDWKKSWVILPHISRRKKKCHFLSSSSRGRQNFFFIFVVLIPERVTRARPQRARPSASLRSSWQSCKENEETLWNFYFHGERFCLSCGELVIFIYLFLSFIPKLVLVLVWRHVVKMMPSEVAASNHPTLFDLFFW